MGIIDKTKQALISAVARRMVELTNSQDFKIALGNNGFLYNAQSYSDSRSFAEKGYNGNLYVHAVIKQKAGLAASVPFKVYKVKDVRKAKHYNEISYKQNKLNKPIQLAKAQAFEEVYDTAVNELLEHPNALQGAKEYNEGVYAMKDIAGETFELGISGSDTEPLKFSRMFQLYPWDVEIELGDNFLNPIAGYKINSVNRSYDIEQFLHMKYFNPVDFWRGLSPLQSGINAILENTAHATWGQALAEQNGFLPGVLNFEGLQDGQALAIKEKLREQKIDVDGAGLPVVTGGQKASWLSFGINPRDADQVNKVKLTAEQIAIMFNYPAELVSGDKKFNNFEQAQKWAWQSSIIPMLDDRRDELNRWLAKGLLDKDNLYIDYDVSGVEALQPDLDARSVRVRAEWRDNLITLEEARDRLELDTTGLGLMAGFRYNDMLMVSADMRSIEADIARSEKAIAELMKQDG